MVRARGAILEEVVRRVIEAAQPEKIILFGSAARRKMGADSDIDLLVVKSGVHRRRLAQAIYIKLLGVGCPVDVIVVTPEDIERYRNAIGLIIGPVLKEGKVVYERLPNDGCVPNRWDGAILDASTALCRSNHVN